MSFDVAITNAAEDDIDNSFQWYERRESGLGIAFLNQLEIQLEVIKNTPYLYPSVVAKNIHRCLLKRFPYAIYFEIDDKVVTIFAILHQHRNPKVVSARAE